MKKKNIGSTFDSWLREQGLYENVSTTAIKRVVARRAHAHPEEVKRINGAADQLNSAADVLEYQAREPRRRSTK